MNTTPTIAMKEKDLLEDAWKSQRQLTAAYNQESEDCLSPAVRDELLHILREEQGITFNLLNEMNKRGWYASQQAQATRIDAVKQQFAGASGN